jgi:hypothetical protein
MPPRQFGAGRRSPRRYHSGGTIRKHEHGRGPGQHPVAGYPEDFIRHIMNRRVSMTGTGGSAFMEGADTTYWNPETGEESYMSPSARALHEEGGPYDSFATDDKIVQEKISALKKDDPFWMFTPEGRAWEEEEDRLHGERRQRDLAMVRQYSREKPHSVPRDIRRHWGGMPRTADEGGYRDMPLAERREGAEDIVNTMLERRGEASIGMLNSAQMRDLMSGSFGPAVVDSVLAERMLGPTAPGGREFYLGGNPDRPETRKSEPYWRRKGWKSGDQQRASGGIIGLQTGGPAPTGQYSGYGGPGQMQIRQETLNPNVAQQYGQLTGAIMQAGARPLQQFGPGVAGMTQMEAAAQAGIGAYGRGQGPQGTIQGMSTLGQAAQGIGSMIPQQQALASQYGAMAPQALQQAQAGAQGMQNLAGRAELQGQLAGAGMRQTGFAAQAEQQAMGAQQAARGLAGQQQLAGFGAGMAGAGQQALAAQQQMAQQQQQLGAGAQQAGLAREAQAAALGAGAAGAGQAGQEYMMGLSQQAAGLGGDIRGQLGGTGAEARQVGQIGAADIRQAGLESQQLGQQALAGIGAAGGRAEQASAEAAQRMRQIGGQAPQLQKGDDLSQYMSQYTQGVTAPQLEQLQEFARQQGEEAKSQEALAGAFGGSRAKIGETERQKNIQQQAAGIIGAGQQKAHEAAVAAFQQDRAAQQQAQQMGLTAEERAAQSQQTGIGAAQQAAAQGFGAAQQGQAARQAAAQSAVQAQQQGISALQQAQTAGGSAAQQGMGQQAQLAQQGLAAGQAGRQAQLQAMGQGTAAGQWGAGQQMQAGQQAAGMAGAGAGALQAALAGQAGVTGQGIGMGMQGDAAQRAAATQGAQFGMQGQERGFGMAQQGISTGLTGLQAAQQARAGGFGTAANLMQGQQGAMGAQMGAYGQLAGVAGQQLTGGQNQQNQFMARQRMMEQAGGRQRQLAQAGLDYQRAQFDQRQQYPQQQIGWMNQQLGALPYQSTVTQGTYAQQPGTAQSLMGAGLQGLGLYNAYQNRGTQGGATG